MHNAKTIKMSLNSPQRKFQSVVFFFKISWIHGFLCTVFVKVSQNRFKLT